MYYLIINKETNKVSNILNSRPISFSDNCILAEVENLPEKYDYLVAENITEKTRSKKISISVEENGEIINKESYVDETYLTANVIAKFKETTKLSPDKISALRKIRILKRKLEETDYQAIKYAEGWLTEREYSSIKAQRNAWREEINFLEKIL